MNFKIKITFIIVLVFAVLVFYLKLFAPKSVFNLGMDYEDRGQFGEALLCYDIAIFLDSKLPKAHFRRGRMILNSEHFNNKIYRMSSKEFINNRYDKRTADYRHAYIASQADFQKALKNDPKEVSNYLFLGMVYLLRSMYNEAYNCFNNAVNIDSRNLFAYFGRAMSSDFNRLYERDRKRNNEIALRDYSFVIQNLDLNAPASEYYDFNYRITVEAREVFEFRAKIYIKTGKYLEAIADLDQAVKLAPGDDRLLFERGNLKSEIGDYIGAIKDYDRIVETDFASSKYYFARANAKKEIGDLEGFEEDIRSGKKIEEEIRLFEMKRR